ncbi:Uncharacterised protein [Escherichia coli]|uniref:Uncharacterized protein n=1 Tax=Escherichia coli TaxID=562 RepID=A0A376L3T2_ECOLX|nr:Uncharacterised protein [Escherichia coli]
MKITDMAKDGLEITLLYLSCFYGIYIVIPLRYGTFCYRLVITREYLLWV